MKQYKRILFITGTLILLPMLAGIVLWEKLPDTIATHFGMDGTPNGWSSREFAVFGMPLFLLAVHFVCIFATSADPKRRNMSEKLFALILWICPVISILVSAACYAYALSIPLNIGGYAGAFTGILFLVVGNYLPKCRQNYTMGIKIPWTLADEDNWNHTHRMAGYLWMLCGLVMLANIFLRQEWLVLAVIFTAVVVPMVYSYIYYVRHGRR